MSLRERLKDPALFREQAFVGGVWVAAGATLQVTDPATGAEIGNVPALAQLRRLKGYEGPK
jgi:succinate-semialdehyde dehydrogenase/glutarate-semialdehyde dehydrogenase